MASADITVTGGTTYVGPQGPSAGSQVNIGYNQINDAAYINAKALAAAITNAFQNVAATLYDGVSTTLPGGAVQPGMPPSGDPTIGDTIPANSYLVVVSPFGEYPPAGSLPPGFTAGAYAVDYAAISIQNGYYPEPGLPGPNSPSMGGWQETIVGGTSSYGGNQSVLAGNGGLVYSAQFGNVTVDAIGGNNYIDVSADPNSAFISLGAGNPFNPTGPNAGNTVLGSLGSNTISAGLANNLITLAGNGPNGSGPSMPAQSNSTITTSGTDTINVGSYAVVADTVAGTGSALISVTGGDSIIGSNTGGSNRYQVIFQNGSSASTVVAAAGQGGSFSVSAGAGGGYYQGGAAGGNYLAGGSGAATLVAGGGGDTLMGGTGAASIVAGTGPELIITGGSDTVLAGSGAETINATSGSALVQANPGMAGSTQITFIGGSSASTVLAGSGSDTITAGSGGGVYYGGNGAAGISNNFITGGGTLTIFGGGQTGPGGGGDTLSGAFAGNTGHNLLVAGGGNETLIASQMGFDTLSGSSFGMQTFDFRNVAGFKQDTITNWNTQDQIVINSAENPYTVTTGGGSTLITLHDATKIYIVGYTGNVTGNIKVE